MEQQPMVRKVMRPLKSPNITLAQARRMFRQIQREEDARKKAEQRAGRSEPEARHPEA